MEKTVCGVAYYARSDEERSEALRVAQEEFHGLLRPEHVQSEGQVLLGTPLGGDSEAMTACSSGYRERKLLEMVDAHDQRLRAVVGLARRSGMVGTSTQRISAHSSCTHSG